MYSNKRAYGLVPQHIIRTRVLSVESLKVCRETLCPTKLVTVSVHPPSVCHTHTVCDSPSAVALQQGKAVWAGTRVHRTWTICTSAQSQQQKVRTPETIHHFRESF